MKVGDRVKAPRFKCGTKGYVFTDQMGCRVGLDAVINTFVSSGDGVTLRFDDGAVFGYPFKAFKPINKATQILDDKDKFMGALKQAYEAGQSDVNKSFNQWVFETLQSTLNDK